MGAQNDAVTSKSRNTNAHELFPRTVDTPIIKAKARVIGEGLTDPSNLGSIFRLMGCFGLNELLHVHKDNHDPPLWDDVPLTSLIRTSAKGCEQHVQRTFATNSELCMYLAEEDRAPVVAIETAEFAESMHTFKFPETCAIMVGNEGLGLRPAVVHALRPGFDSFVVIPMCGPHISLNVATALGCALYEYRRQWPLTP
jgi:tRNA G18 (ribose-2'-O)-methylase SpoU